LAISFELSPDAHEHLEELLDLPIRTNLHATVVYYGRDAARMADAEAVLRAHDPNQAVPLRLTRLGKVQTGNRSLAWASLEIPLLAGERDGLHATLIADGFKPKQAREGELAYDSGDVVDLEGEEYSLEKIDLEPLEFKGEWSLLG
jgi:hypothetical protein